MAMQYVICISVFKWEFSHTYVQKLWKNYDLNDIFPKCI